MDAATYPDVPARRPIMALHPTSTLGQGKAGEQSVAQGPVRDGWWFLGGMRGACAPDGERQGLDQGAAFGHPRHGPDDLADARACGYAAGPRGQSGGGAGRARRVTCPGRSGDGTATGQLASAQTVRPG